MKKKLAVIVFMAALTVACLGIGTAIEPSSSLQPIEPESPCPAVGCVSGECHGFGSIPKPDGIHEMTCPEAGCTSVECHAWDTMIGRYHQASDASLNVWILMPTVLVLSIVLITRVLSKRGVS